MEDIIQKSEDNMVKALEIIETIPPVVIVIEPVGFFSNLSLDERCAGCERIKFEQICGRHLEPKKLWTKLGGCASRTHSLKELESDEKSSMGWKRGRTKHSQR